MKKALLISDTHLEYDKDLGASFLESLPTEGIDILIAAGDICSFSQLSETLRKLCAMYPQVVYTPGNHECWGASIRMVAKLCDSLYAEIENLHVLDCRETIVSGVEFVGATMWFKKHELVPRYARRLNDFSEIRNFSLDPSGEGYDVFAQNAIAEEFLYECVSRDSVVVTHYLPHELSVSPRFKGSPTNIFFLNDMSYLIDAVAPQVWVHGHTHDSCDYMVGNTRVVCNPRGYSFEPNDGFEFKILELKEKSEGKGGFFQPLIKEVNGMIERVEKLRDEVRSENEALDKLLRGISCPDGCGEQDRSDEDGCCLSCGQCLLFDDDGNPRPAAEPYLHPGGPFGLIDDLRKRAEEAESGWEKANERAKDLEQQLYVVSCELEEALEKAKLPNGGEP